MNYLMLPQIDAKIEREIEIGGKGEKKKERIG